MAGSLIALVNHAEKYSFEVAGNRMQAIFHVHTDEVTIFRD